jgi:hypothetical protein
VVTSQLIQMVMWVASSINLSAGGDLTFGTNGSITAQYGVEMHKHYI